MNTVQIALYVLIYLVIGFGGFWICTKKLDTYYEKKLMKRYPGREDIIEEYKKNKSSIWFPDCDSCSSAVLLIIVSVILGILVWGLWPVAIIFGCAYRYYKYKKVCKNYPI